MPPGIGAPMCYPESEPRILGWASSAQPLPMVGSCVTPLLLLGSHLLKISDGLKEVAKAVGTGSLSCLLTEEPSTETEA